MRTVPTLLALWAASVCAQVPVTLKAGDKATAAEVMQNFKYLDSLNSQAQKDLSKLQGVVIGNQSELSNLKQEVRTKLDSSLLTARLLHRDTSAFSIGHPSSSANHLDWFPEWGSDESMLRISGIGSPPNGVGFRYHQNEEYGFFLGSPYTEFSILVNPRKDSLSIGMRGRGRPVNAMITDGSKVRFPDQIYADNGLQVQGSITTNGDVVMKGSLTTSGEIVSNGSINTPKDLSVGGSLFVRAKQIAPDYVFEPGYHLMPLSELSAYVETNRHLPEVPDAQAIASQGVDVAQMNLILLRKVEELTLHVIGLERSLDSLRAKREP